MMPVQRVDYVRGMDIVSPVYLDANFPVACLYEGHDKYQTANELLGELLIQNVEIYISTLALDEVWHSLLRSWYTSPTRTGPKCPSTYRPELEADMSRIESWGVIFLPTAAIDAWITTQRSFDFMTQENLKPRDSFHLALATLSNAAGFITSDDDFDNITLPGGNLTIYKY